MQNRIIFINEENNSEYAPKVVAWIETNNKQHDCSEVGFLSNSEVIVNAFKRCEAMVVLNNQDNIIAYMLWNASNGRLHIDIVEVSKNFRRKGIFKGMLTALTGKFNDLLVLSASPIQQSMNVFRAMAWEMIVDRNGSYHCYKILQPSLSPLDILPDYSVIAIFSITEVVDTEEKPNDYHLKYFRIELNQDKKLKVPIITSFHPNSYVGIYLNKKLITSGKVRHLLSNSIFFSEINLLILERFEPRNLQLFADFFTQAQTQNQKPLHITTIKKIVTSATIRSTTEENNCEQPNIKRRLTSTSTFFKLQESANKVEATLLSSPSFSSLDYN